MARVSSKMSFTAAHMASVSTVMTSSRNSRQRRKVSAPAWRTATPSAKRPTVGSTTRSPASSAAAMQAASSGSTPITLVSGRRYFTKVAMPAARPPPPTGTKIASIGPECWVRISMPMVPWPAITSGSSKGCRKVRPSRASQLAGMAQGLVEGVAEQDDLGAPRPAGIDLDRRGRARHHDHGAHVEACGRQRHALRVVAGRGADDAAWPAARGRAPTSCCRRRAA